MKLARRFPGKTVLSLLCAFASSCGQDVKGDLDGGSGGSGSGGGTTSKTSDASADAGADGGVADASTCGHSHCESTLWPRLAVVFGNPAAGTLTYTFVTNDGTWTWTSKKPDIGFCPVGYGESAAYHCDIGFDVDPYQTEVTMTVQGATVPAASIHVPLAPFNYCGNGTAEVIVSVDQGNVSFDAIHYVNACGL